MPDFHWISAHIGSMTERPRPAEAGRWPATLGLNSSSRRRFLCRVALSVVPRLRRPSRRRPSRRRLSTDKEETAEEQAITRRRLPGWLRASCGRHMRALRLCHTTSALFASADVIQGPFDGECRLQSGGRSTTPACNMSGQVGDDIGRDPTTPSGRVWRDGWEAGSIYGFTG